MVLIDAVHVSSLMGISNEISRIRIIGMIRYGFPDNIAGIQSQFFRNLLLLLAIETYERGAKTSSLSRLQIGKFRNLEFIVKFDFFQ